MNEFVHLRLRTEYSVTSSVVRIDPLMALIGEHGTHSVAVNDCDNLFGSFKFSASAVSSGIKPVLGADILLTGEDDAHLSGGLLTLLICNRTGYENLCRLISLSYETRRTANQARVQYREPLVSIQSLRENSAGLIALSAGANGFIGGCLHDAKEELALARIHSLLDCFADRFYLSIERIWNNINEKRHIEFCIQQGQALSIPVVATNNVQFLKPDDFTAHTIRVGIYENRNINDQNLQARYSPEQYLKTPQQMSELFADLPETVGNSVEISRRCNYFLTVSPQPFLPHLPTPEGESTEEHLSKKSRALLETMLKEEKRTSGESKIYRQRLEMELSTINNMGFAAYFLIVDEFVNWARAHEVVVGPGRGSGPGSLVAYVLGITRVDPIVHELLFERFLNPERVSLPDFDIDFDDQRRDLVITHVAELYGREKVAQIITFGTMAARAVVRDVGRVLGKPYGQVDRIAKQIPFAIDMTLDRAMDSSEFSSEYKNPETREIVDRAMEIEGLARNPGRHAGGVVIAPKDLSEFCPLYCDDEGVTITQFDKDDLEAIGLVKYDFLSLRVLSTIRDAITNIERATGETINIEKIDLQDSKTLDLINREYTLGIFQLESTGMRELIRKLKPDSFNDIVALVALYRPGPMEAKVHDIYCDRKHGNEAIAYYHQSLQAILEPTYGVFIYQEQVMEAAQVMAGYSLGGADLLRRAISKKKPEELARQKPGFIEGCKKNNISKKVAEEVFELLSHFAGYGFNKSHSVSYGLLAFQTAWLKSHHPAAYMAALMTNEPNHDNIARMVRDCKRMGITIEPPDINRSALEFLVLDEHRILYGLGRIKGVGYLSRHGSSFVEQVCAEREKNGLYKDFIDFLVRIPHDKCSSKTLMALVGSGACDPFLASSDRLTMIDAIERNIQDFARARRVDIANGQGGLFGSGSDDQAVAGGFEYQSQARNIRQELYYEYEALNFYLGEHHPVSVLRHDSPQLARLPRLAKLRELRGTYHCLFEIRDVATSRRNNRLTVSCDDEDSNQILFFPHERMIISLRSPWNCKTKTVLAEVECTSSRVVIQNLYLESDMAEKFCRRLDIGIEHGDVSGSVDALKTMHQQLIKSKPGQTRICFHYRSPTAKGQFEFPQGVCLSNTLFELLSERCPELSLLRSHYVFK